MRSEMMLATLWMYGELRFPERELHIYLQKLIK